MKKYSGTDSVHPLPDPTLTEPALVITPHKDAKGAKEKNAKIANREEI
jgi:anaerobic dimethyl sulfoxide reductase subunit B (iron-sulfur subunit)